MRKRISLLFLLFGVFVAATGAQTAFKNDPFSAGETLTYEGKLSKGIFRGLGVAELRFAIGNSPDRSDYLIKAEAVSKGSLVKLFGFRFVQRFESTIERDKFRILKTVKYDQQRDRVRNGEAVFDYREKQVIYVETDPRDTARPPRRIASAIGENTQDLVSGIYTLRRLPLAVGKTFDISVSDSGLVYTIPVRVAAREQQNSILGKVWCFRLEAEVFGTKRFIEEEGNLTIWITDDKTRVPVRSQIRSSMGKLEIKLRQIGK